MKKIKEKAAAAADNEDGTPPVTPAKTPKSSGTKRKGKFAAGDAEGTPTKKKRGKKVKAEEVDGECCLDLSICVGARLTRCTDDEEAADVKESIE